MKRILFLTHRYPLFKNDQSGIFFRYWIESLKRSNIHIDIVTPSWNESNNISREFGDYKEIIWTFHWNKVIDNPKIYNVLDLLNVFYFLFKWKNLISKVYSKCGKWDLVIAAWGIPAGLLLGNKKFHKTSKVIWWLGSDYHKFKKGIFKYLLKFVLKKPNVNWAQSLEIQSGLRKLTKNSVKLVPNQPQKFLDVKERKFNKLPLILSIGRLEKIKNFAFGIKAIKELINSGIDLRYEIIGEGSEKNNLVELIGKQNKIKILGYRNKKYINEKLKRADILLITSISEGNPNVFFEALAYGVVVVSTEVGDIKSITRKTKLAFTSQQGDLKQLVKNLKKALNGELKFNNAEAQKIFKNYASQISIDSALKMLNIN